MDSASFIVAIGIGVLLAYGIGVFAMNLHAGENIVSAASQASAWWAAFSISHLFGYLAITLR